MPVEVGCQSCGARLRIPDHQVGTGKPLACPRCGQPVFRSARVPAAGNDMQGVPVGHWAEEPPSARSPFESATEGTAADRTQGDGANDSDDMAAAPARFGLDEPEPWFYRFLEVYAKVVMWLGIIFCALGLALNLYVVVRASSDDARLLLGLPFVFLFWLLVLIGVLLGVAFILLAVDAGRRLRSIDAKTKG